LTELLKFRNYRFNSNSNELDEIVVTSSILDIAKDRKLLLQFLQSKHQKFKRLGSQEFPEILANTPSVYVTKQGGGFGDARIIFVDLTKEI
jgi:outer membrane cobalamin receptor